MVWIIIFGLYVLYEVYMTISYFYWSKDERMGISKSGHEDK